MCCLGTELGAPHLGHCQESVRARCRPFDEFPTDRRRDNLDYLRIVFRYRIVVLLICIIGTGVTATRSLMGPKVYQATTSVVPSLKTPQGGSLALGGGGMSIGGADGSLLSQALSIPNVTKMYVGILRSREVADAVIDRFDLISAYGGGQYHSRVRKQLQDNTDIEVSDNAVLRVTVTDTDPNRAAAIANAYMEELDRQNKKLSCAQAASWRLFLETRLKEVERMLGEFEKLPARDARIQEMLYELLVREYEIAKIEEVKSLPTIQILDEAVPPEIRMPRGTVQRTLSAGMVSFVLGIFATFILEYAGHLVKESRQGRKQPEASDAADPGEGPPVDLEGERGATATHRKKRVSSV